MLHRMKNLYDIIDNGAKYDYEKIAIEYNDESFSYAELISEVLKIAENLKQYGITKNSKVGIILENPCDFILNIVAVSYLGGIPMPIYFNTGNEKIKNVVKYYEINYIITTKELDYEEVYLVKEECFRIYKNSDVIDYNLEDVALILFTSGSTGTPKAIMLTIKNIISNVLAISKYLNIRTDDRLLLIKNLCHASSLIGELFVGLQNGCTVILSTKLPRANLILNMIVDSQISIFFAVPTILKQIILQRNASSIKLDNLRIINFYGAPMNYSDINKLAEMMPNCNLIYSYGLTEASPRVTYIERSDLAQKTSSSGKTIENVDIKIIDEFGREQKPNNIGEIIVNGPNVMKGYYKDPDKTKRTIVNGWLHTGDLGYLDEKGFLYVKGRIDNMVISFGKNIYIEEIESTINSIDGVAECLVKAIQNDDGIVRLCAYVVLENKEITVSRIYEYCVNNLENYKVPRKIELVDYLEKTDSEKIKRQQINIEKTIVGEL